MSLQLEPANRVLVPGMGMGQIQPSTYTVNLSIADTLGIAYIVLMKGGIPFQGCPFREVTTVVIFS